MPTASYLEELVSEYRDVVADPSRPFPRVATFRPVIPPDEVLPVDVKTGFTALLEQASAEQEGAVRLLFPEGVDDLVVPNRCVGAELLDAAVAKIGRWLSDVRNATYAEGKLVALLRGSEAAARRLAEEAAQRPRMAATRVREPDEIAFRFWTYLANLILADLRQKKEKTPDDHGLCQSCWIVGYVVVWRKGRRMHEQERAADLKSLEALVRKPPYLFGYEDLYDLKDVKGVPFSAKHTRTFIHEFVKEKLRAAEPGHLPFLVHLAAAGHDWFVQRDLVAPVFLQKLSEAATELRERYLDEWVERLKRFETAKPMKSEEAFRGEVELRVKEEFPLLAGLANAPLLRLAKDETNVPESARADLEKCLARDGSLKPMAELLGLVRSRLLRDARSYLPLWQVIPVVSHLVRLLRKLFGSRAREATRALADDGRGTEEMPLPQVRPAVRTLRGRTVPEAEPSAAPSPPPSGSVPQSALVRYRRAVTALRERVVPQGSTLASTLAELAERWNPLYADEQKRNLVEDVNSLVRDVLRKVRRSFLVNPPTLERLHELAQRLAMSRNLEKIKNQEALVAYIELYMIRCLELKR